MSSRNYYLLITYDISSDKLRSLVHKFLSRYGVNSQKSVFEMKVSQTDHTRITRILYRMMYRRKESDSIRIYRICRSCRRHIFTLGITPVFNELEWQIV